jgi:hypothetical protein
VVGGMGKFDQIGDWDNNGTRSRCESNANNQIMSSPCPVAKRLHGGSAFPKEQSRDAEVDVLA